MAKTAAKKATKKGKYFEIFSSGTHLLNMKPVGHGRLWVGLAPHGIGMLVYETSLSWHGVEVRITFRN